MLKKIITGTIAAIMIAIWGLWYLGGKSLEKQALAQKNIDAAAAGLIQFKKQNQPDSDNDGLKDWEERLWDTDPHNPDTDDDGTPDGEEVKLRRDPKRKTPDDELSETNKKLAAFVKTTQETKNAPTIKVSPEELNKPTLTYKLSDLKTTTEAENEKVIQDYGHAFRQIMAVYASQHQENLARVLLNFLDNGDRAELTKISRSRQAHIRTIFQLLNLRVPGTASELHLTLLNNIAALGESIYQMEQADKEPLIALPAAQFYLQRYITLMATLNDFNNYFITKKIKFGPDSPQPNFYLFF